MQRRHFLQGSALTLASLATAAAEEKPAPAARPLAFFTKTFEQVPAAELGERLAALGVRAIEAPIRKGGHIEPQDVAERLPAFVGALGKHGVTLEILTSDIGRADPGAEQILRTAAQLGIRRYRLAHFHYDLKKPLAPQLADIRARLRDLAALNRELGVQGQTRTTAATPMSAARSGTWSPRWTASTPPTSASPSTSPTPPWKAPARGS